MNGMRTALRPRPWAWVLAVVALAALIVWQISAWDRTGSTEGADSSAAVDSTKVGLTMFPPGERPKVPTLEGSTLEGNQFDLADLAGHVVVINVWGSWCGPCRTETPDLVRVARETADRGVRFVGVDTRDSLAAARAFTEDKEVPYPSVFDQNGRALLPLGSVIPISAVPSTIVVDRDGNIAARVIGPVTYTTLSGLLDDIAGTSR